MNLKELLTIEYKDTLLEYTGSIFGNNDGEEWIDTGEEIYWGLVHMFGEDALEETIVLDTHPVYTGERGMYIQAGDIWDNVLGEECVFAVVD